MRAGWERGKIWVTGLGLRVGGGDWVSVLAGIGGGWGAEMGWGEGWRVVVDGGAGVGGRDRGIGHW